MGLNKISCGRAGSFLGALHRESNSLLIWVVGKIQFFTVVGLRSIPLLAISEGCIQLGETTYIPGLSGGGGLQLASEPAVTALPFSLVSL